MSKLIKKEFIPAIAAIVIGILFIAFKGEVLRIAATIIGFALVVLGLIELLQAKKDNQKIEGLIKLAIGVVIIVLGWTIVEFILYILGVILIVFAVYNIIMLVSKKKLSLNTLLFPAFQFVIGVLLMLGKLGDIMMYIIGAALIIYGVLEIATSLKKKK